MHFITIAIALLAAATGTLANVQCNIRAFSPTTDKAALHACLNGYRTDNWDGMDCGGLGWFKGSRAYNSPTNCYDACSSCISTAIDAGAIDIQCDDYEGAADCWMGYH
ncbi:hypothetical protein JAAARDRAFT_295597 [Jaapia argillacea MUCL 33604]|uniref:Uncharacterized protein n=1 Tax=Jaapia argillacea MUCL 33604 TaxID=933084 RepID=A0A067PRW8_9AGAM|nr:hypothetical protein JAAARDRAFT_295597 [Jaapia argillacea MUCL 33604]